MADALLLGPGLVVGRGAIGLHRGEAVEQITAEGGRMGELRSYSAYCLTAAPEAAFGALVWVAPGATALGLGQTRTGRPRLAFSEALFK